MDKQSKLDIIVEALDVLYNEVNDFSIHTDYPIERLVNVLESIKKLEGLYSFLNYNPFPFSQGLDVIENWQNLQEFYKIKENNEND